MSTLTVRAEISKLARLYQVDDHVLEFLQILPAAEIRRLREAVQERLFSDNEQLFKRLGSASALLPLGLIAMMAEKIFGPVLAARVAGEMNHKRAAALTEKLPIVYLADISVQIDPRRARDIIRQIAPARIREVAAELLRRGEFITMGRFVDYVTGDGIRAALEAFKRPTDLLQAGFFIENKAQLDMLIRMLPDDRLRNVIAAAQDPQHDLWPEALALMEHVDDSLKRRLGDLTVDQGDTALSHICRITSEQRLWDVLLPVVARMSESSHRRLLRIPELSDSAIMADILGSANDNGLWPDFLPLVKWMDADQLTLIAQVATGLPTAALENLLRAAHAADLWESILQMAAGMDQAQLAQLAGTATILPREAIARCIEVADELDLWQTLLPLAGHMDNSHKRMIADLAALASHDTGARIVAAAHAADGRLWPSLLDIVALIPGDQRGGYADIIAEYAAREPQLIVALTPALQSRGLDDVLEIAGRSKPPKRGAASKRKRPEA